MRKALVSLTLMTIFLVLLCSTATALEGKKGPYSYSVKKNGDLCITAFDWNAYGNEDVYIPKMIDGYSVTEIGEYAFSGKEKSKAVAVIIPDTVLIIGDYAFFESPITTMHIPSSVKSIGEGAFAGCSNIRQFSVDKSNARYAQIDGVLYNKISKELVAFPAMFSDHDYSIPEGIVSIAPYAFYRDTIKGTLSLPSTLISIGHHAFKKATIGGIGSYANITLTSVTTLGEGAFEDCFCRDGYRKLSLDASQIVAIPDNCFRNIRMYDSNKDQKSILLPNTLVSIGAYAFAEATQLGWIELIIPSSVETIGQSAFEKCRFTSLSFEDGSALKTIGDDAFSNAGFSESFKRIKLPEGLVSLGSRVFLSNFPTQPNELVIPTSVKKIGDNIYDRNRVNIIAEEGSYAYFWAVENGYTISHPSDTSWLDGSGEAEQPDTSWLND